MCVLQRVAACYSVLQCVAVHCSVSTGRLVQTVSKTMCVLQGVAGCCRVLVCVAECCSVLQCVAVCCIVLQCVFLPLPPLFHSFNLQVRPLSLPPFPSSLLHPLSQSCHTYEWVMPYTYHTRQMHQWIMQRIWIRHVTHINESCHTHEWVISHPYLTRTMYQRITPHFGMSHVTQMNETCCTCECVISHTWMRHITHMNGLTESCHTAYTSCRRIST